jgi:hypothetical protein
LAHCWAALKDCPKWHDLYASYDANTPGKSNVIDVDGEATSAPMKRPRGRTSSKAEAKREASSQAMMETINTLITDKEVSREKREERKGQEKEDAVKNYYEMQNKKLEIEKINTRAAAKEVGNK